jgi:hypothetical protein
MERLGGVYGHHELEEGPDGWGPHVGELDARGRVPVRQVRRRRARPGGLSSWPSAGEGRDGRGAGALACAAQREGGWASARGAPAQGGEGLRVSQSLFI